MKRVSLYPLLLGLVCFACFSCKNDTPVPLPEEDPFSEIPSIMVFFPPNGPGDNGYLDKILGAAARFSTAHPGALRIFQTTEADIDSHGGSLLLPSLDMMTISETQQDTVLAIFVGSEFKNVLYQSEAPQGKLKVLLVEDDGVGAPEWLHTGQVDRYGASYLSGAMVAQQRAIIIAAMPGEPVLDRSVEGFIKGYGSIKGREVESIYYLANDYKGFTMQNKAHAIVDSFQLNMSWNYYTIYPLAGAANMGVYNGLHETSLMQAIGVDNDYSAHSDNIPFSINIGVDKLIQDYIEQWHATRQLPKRRVEGLGSKYVEFVFNDRWNNNGVFFDWEDESMDWSDLDTEATPELWKQRYALFIDKAIEEEKAYAKH